MTRPVPPCVIRQIAHAAPRLGTLVILMLFMATACSGGPTPVAGPIGAAVKVTPTPVAPPTEVPAPQPLPVSAPFNVVVTDIQIAPISHNGVFGVADAPVDDGVALAAVQAAAVRLTGFLNAMFVDPATRLSDAAVATVIDPNLMPPEARSGLGVLARDDVLGTVAQSAAATAQVQIDGTTVGAVTLFYSASLDIALELVRGPVQQQGSAAFVDRGAGMRLIAIDASTIFGGALSPVLS